MWLGIDFGTCFSSAVLIQGYTPSMVAIPERNNCYAIPTCVYVKDATKIYVGYEAYAQRLRDTSKYKDLFKRDLGRTNPYYIGDEEFLPEDLAVKVIEKLKALAEKQFKVNITRATIAVPASHTAHKRQLMIQAGKKAGFTEVHIVDEPIAAAVYYSQRSTTKDEEILLVYDLGGGTFDASLIQRKGSGYTFLVPPTGDPQCGGMDFDREIFKDFKGRCTPEQRALLERSDRQALRPRFQLTEYCRQLKENLSFQPLDSFTIPLLGDEREYELTRPAFERLIAPYVGKTISLCKDLLRNAGLSAEKVDRILLVGGSCKIPYVRKAIERDLNRPVIGFEDLELAVGKGAATWEGWNPGYDLLQAGIDLADIGDYQGAIGKYYQALQKNPNYARAYFSRAEANLELGNRTNVAEDLKRALQLEPDYADAYHLYAQFHSYVGDYKKAIAYCEQVLQINPNYIEAYNEIAKNYQSIGKKEEAKEYQQQALEIKPETAQDFACRGEIYQYLQNFEAALSEYNRAIELNHSYAEGYTLRGYIYSKLKNPLGTTNDFNQALSLNPNYSHAFGWRGVYYHEEGEFEKAINEFNQALKINPNYFFVYDHRGWCLLYLNNYQGAMDDFNKMLQINPHYSGGYSGLGDCYLALDNHNEALANYNKALELNSTNANAYYGLGQILHQQQKLDEAIVEYQKAIEIEPKYTMVYNSLGIALENQGETEKAIEAYTKAIELYSEYPWPVVNLGYLLLKNNEKEKGLQMLKKAKDLFQKYGNTEEVKNIQNTLQEQEADPYMEKAAIFSWFKKLNLS